MSLCVCVCVCVCVAESVSNSQVGEQSSTEKKEMLLSVDLSESGPAV